MFEIRTNMIKVALTMETREIILCIVHALPVVCGIVVRSRTIVTQRSRVRVPPGPLSSNNLEQVIYTHGAHGPLKAQARGPLCATPLHGCTVSHK